MLLNYGTIDMKIEEVLARFEQGEKMVALSGVEGWSLALQLRVTLRPSLVKQIINQDLIPQFHRAQTGYVQGIIAQRVQLGIAMQNLITYGEVKEIERSNQATLKQTKMLPQGFVFKSMIAVFGGIVTITSLESVTDTSTVLIKEEVMAESIEAFFDSMWQQSLFV